MLRYSNFCPNSVNADPIDFLNQIPDSLGALSKLEDLDLSNNRFDGCLPPGLQSLQLLVNFLASNNELSGEIPPYLGNLTALKRLALDGNNFEGTIPCELGKLTSLEGLYLERNQLVSSRLFPGAYLEGKIFWGRMLGSLPRLFSEQLTVGLPIKLR